MHAAGMGMGIADSPSLQLPLILGAARRVSCLAVELREIEPLELIPVAVDDAHTARRLDKVSEGGTYSDSGLLLTW